MTERRTRPDGERPLASLTLPGSSSSARSARDLLRDELTGRFPPSVLDDLLLLVSELVSNAAAASSGRFRLTVTCDHDMLRVELIDGSDVFPQLAHRGPLAENGRGLWLVDALALDWGTVPQPSGKMVWFTLRVSSQGSLDPYTDQVADQQAPGIEKTLTELVAVDENAPGVAGADATLQRVGAEPRDRPAASARCTPTGASAPLPPRRSDRSGRLHRGGPRRCSEPDRGRSPGRVGHDTASRHGGAGS